MLPIGIGVIILIITGFIFSQTHEKEQADFNSDVKGEIKIAESTPVPSFSPSPSPSTQPNFITNDNILQYPNSKATNNTTYVSFDNPEAITNWYKNKLRSLGFSNNSFVTTTANGQVKNELVTANFKTEYRIKITQPQDQDQVTIEVLRVDK